MRLLVTVEIIVTQIVFIVTTECPCLSKTRPTFGTRKLQRAALGPYLHLAA